MATYGYTRVSTRIQSDEGLSLEAQARQIEGYAQIHALSITNIFVERAVSGYRPLERRPEGHRLMTILKPGDIIICAKLDRMFRSARDALSVAETLQKQGVSLHLIDLGGDVTGNGIGRMFFTIVAAFAQFERERIAERVADVKATEREKGRFLGGHRPFGYRVGQDGELEADHAEQAVINKVIALRDQGLSLRAIAKSISSNRAADSRLVSHVTVRRILKDAGAL